MQLDHGTFCPLIGDKCKKLECAWFIKVRGKDPNTGMDVDEWNCAVSWMPILQIETSQQSRSTGAAVESFRNEVVKANKENQELYMNQLQSSNPKQKNVFPLNQPINTNNILGY